MSLRATQGGALMIIAVVLIVVMSFLALAITSLFVTNTNAVLDQANSDQALFIAESGLERGLRQWVQNGAAYTGEGPLVFGSGEFTIYVRPTDSNGAALPANQRRITSLAAVPASNGGAAVRTTEVIAQSTNAGFSEPFTSITNWPTAGPNGDIFNRSCTATDNVTSQATGGWVTYDATENAPGSTGGAFRAEVNTTVANARLTGYRERALAATLPAGATINLNFWFEKLSFKDKPDFNMLAIDLVATDGTVYRVWSDCRTIKVAWTAVTVNWTVPGGKTINRIRISFDIKNNSKAKTGESQGSLIDELNLTSTAAASASIVSWREVVP